MKHQTTKSERILKLLEIIPRNGRINCKTNVSTEGSNSRVEFHGKNDQTRKKLDKFTILLFLEQSFMGISIVNLVSLYLLQKHKQICFIIPYSICS